MLLSNYAYLALIIPAGGGAWGSWVCSVQHVGVRLARLSIAWTICRNIAQQCLGRCNNTGQTLIFAMSASALAMALLQWCCCSIWGWALLASKALACHDDLPGQGDHWKCLLVCHGLSSCDI